MLGIIMGTLCTLVSENSCEGRQTSPDRTVPNWVKIWPLSSSSSSYHLLRRPSSVAQGRHSLQLVQNIQYC